MRFNLNNKEVQISIHHMSYVDFKKNYPGLVKHSPKKSKKVTVAELIYDNCRSVASSHVHKNDQFNRRKGSVTALERAIKQHPELKKQGNKALRKEVFNKMFRSEPSPYNELDKLVRSRPDLAKKLVEHGKTLLSETTNGVSSNG